MEQGAVQQRSGLAQVELNGFTLDLTNQELRTPSKELAELRNQALNVLLVLGSEVGHVVSKDALMRRVWPNVVVGEDSLAQAIAEIRRVLGDRDHRLIRTVPRRGYMLVPDDPVESKSTPRPEKGSALRLTGWHRPVLIVLGILVAIALGALLMQSQQHGTPARPELPGDVPTRSLVLLPLESEAEEGWFADAVTADLTSNFGRWPNAFVIGRDTARTYKGKTVDPRDVARELGVRYVIRGAVRRDGDRVRIDLAMVDGESGVQRWAEQIDVERARLAQSIDEITGRIARTMLIEVGRAVGDHAAKMHPEQIAADDLAMQGWAIFLRSVGQTNFLEARQVFEQALAKDPNSVRALGGVSISNSFGAIMRWMPDQDASMRRSQEALARLESIDPNGELTLLSRASVANMRGDWEGLLLVATDLIEHYPNHPTSHHHRCSSLLRLGRFEDSIPSCERAIKISPRDSRVAIWQGLIGMNHFMLGQYDVAADYSRRTVTANPNLTGYWSLLVASLALSGRRDDAVQVLNDFMQRDPEFSAESIPALWYGKHPRFVEGRDRLVRTVHELGMPK